MAERGTQDDRSGLRPERGTGPKGRPHFRFMDLDIWREAVEIARMLFRIADRLEARRHFRFAEQLRAAGLSMSNNIAEGSGSNSSREFHNYLNFTRRSTFENANMILVFELEALVEEAEATVILQRLDRLSRKVTNFQRTLG
jgi:four helix bundle protein